MTYGEILQEAFQKLNTRYPEGTKYSEGKNKIRNPHLEAEILLSKIIQKPREYILTHKEKKIDLVNKLRYNYLIYKRINNYPLAYLIKEKYFYGYKFKVNKNTLIPRPETEMIIDEILNIIKNTPKKQYLLMDLGTGSGCIIISALREIKKINSLKNIQAKAIDISQKALKIAFLNAKNHRLEKQIQFFKANLLNFSVNDKTEKKSNLIISANLPYLKLDQLKHFSIKHEPFLALYGGSNGLDYYLELLKQIKDIQNKYKKINLFMEIDPSQKKDISSLILEIHPHAKIEIKKDLRGLFRLVCVEFNS